MTPNTYLISVELFSFFQKLHKNVFLTFPKIFEKLLHFFTKNDSEFVLDDSRSGKGAFLSNLIVLGFRLKTQFVHSDILTDHCHWMENHISLLFFSRYEARPESELHKPSLNEIQKCAPLAQLILYFIISKSKSAPTLLQERVTSWWISTWLGFLA